MRFRLPICIIGLILCFPVCGFSADRDAEIEALRSRVRQLESRADNAHDMVTELAQLRQQISELMAERRCNQVRLMAPPPDNLDEPPLIIPVALTAQLGDSTRDDVPSFDRLDSIVPPANNDSTHSAYGDGLQITLWGWLSYIASPQEHYSTFWAWEGEIDLTRSFTEHLAASADIDFTDMNNGAIANLEQLFVSILLPCDNDAIFTAGKFNAPFGVERRDFWDRQTGSISLLFNAQPVDLTGLMFTQPCPDTHLTLRALVVNGFRDNLDINQQPSLGFVIEHRPCDQLCVALTNWWGPEFADNNDDKLYFTEAQATWQVTPDLCFAGEFLYGTTQSAHGQLDYGGYLTILSYALCAGWQLFGQWSDLNDRDGFITGGRAHLQQASIGLRWFLHNRVEARFEYRHEIEHERLGASWHSEGVDEFSAHLTFGY